MAEVPRWFNADPRLAPFREGKLFLYTQSLTGMGGVFCLHLCVPCFLRRNIYLMYSEFEYGGCILPSFMRAVFFAPQYIFNVLRV